MKNLILFLLLISFKQIEAQTTDLKNSSTQISYLISFGETLPENLLKREFIDQTIWTISNSSDSILYQSVNENTLKTIKFDIPGTYNLSMHFDETMHTRHSNECFHPNIPAEVKLVVSPYKLVFQMDEISFSSVLKGGVDTEGITLEVPVIFSSFDQKQLNIKDLIVSTAGINTEIKGRLMNNEAILIPGRNKLVYTLSGKASKDTYIMFDFVDINKQTQTYYCPQKIN
jgi:hypothetical protein